MILTIMIINTISQLLIAAGIIAGVWLIANITRQVKKKNWRNKKMLNFPTAIGICVAIKGMSVHVWF